MSYYRDQYTKWLNTYRFKEPGMTAEETLDWLMYGAYKAGVAQGAEEPATYFNSTIEDWT